MGPKSGEDYPPPLVWSGVVKSTTLESGDLLFVLDGGRDIVPSNLPELVGASSSGAWTWNAKPVLDYV